MVAPIAKLQKEINNVCKELVLHRNITIDSLNELEYQLNNINKSKLDDCEKEIVELANIILREKNG
ncbi:MAG: hypothetical protein ACRC1M_04310 [Methanobacteriaceae archaeon]